MEYILIYSDKCNFLIEQYNIFNKNCKSSLTIKKI